MLRRPVAVLAVLLLLAGHGPLPAQAPPPPDPELAAGIALVREGDFEAAVLKLDAVVRRLLADSARQQEAARAYVYLGVAFLELGQELVARGKFQLAQGLDPALRLDAREFSPQQIRVFEAARADAAAAPAPPRATPAPSGSPSASPAPAVARAEEQKKKKRSALPWILGGAAVVGGGVAAASGGGGGGAQPPPTSAPTGNMSSTTQPPDTTTTTTQPGAGPTPTPGPSPTPDPTPVPTPTPGATPTPGPTPTPTVPPSSTTTTSTTTTTTTTTTTMPVGCSTASVGPPDQPAYSPLGDSGSCPVTAASSCSWSAAVVGGPSWVTLTTGSGTGSGQISFNLQPNPVGPAREATIFLVQNTAASCTVRQSSAVLTEGGEAALAFTSELDLEGGQAQVVVDGSQATFHVRGTHQGWIQGEGPHRIEGTVVSAAGKPGTWRFRLAGPVRPGSLRVVAGAVAQIGPAEILFRVSGRPGERLLFSFRSH